MIFRDYSGIAAIDMQNGDVVWDAKLEWSFGTVYSDTKKNDRPIDAYRQWLANWQQRTTCPPAGPLRQLRRRHPVRRQRSVYAIEDLPIPAPQNLLVQQNPGWGGVPQNNWGKEVNDALNYNKLIAIRQQGGKTLWELGGA